MDDNDGTNTNAENERIIEEKTLSSEDFITKITMECMMNKKHYRTYLAKTNPEQLNELLEYQSKIEKYSHHFEKIFTDLLENSKENTQEFSKKYNNDIQNSFKSFIMHCLKYVADKMEEMEDDILDERFDDKTEEDVKSEEFRSVWGKSITKI